MKVKELIRQLKKQNQDADVCLQVFDQSENECEGFVRVVCEAGESLCEAEGKKLIVVLRP